MITLVSFLGRARQDPKTGYKEATYRFPDGEQRITAFFGLALREVLSPERLVLLGTSGSMWDVLVEHLATVGQDEDLRLRLIEAATTNAVNGHLLAQVTPLVERALGLPCTLCLIDYGRDAEGQKRILAAIAGSVPEGKVSLDLTHGFRHLTALGLLSAFFLERVIRLEIAGLYYGALEMTEAGITPVVRLDGLMAVQRWIDALDRYDQSGDYGVFTPLLIADGVPEDKARCLQEAAFHERNFNLADAARKIGTFLPELARGLAGMSELFRDRLARRLEWARSGTLSAHQRQLAHLYLERRDFVRAAVLGWESVITRECETHDLDRDDFAKGGGRDQAEWALRTRLEANGEDWKTSPYNRLKALRNSLAHGQPPPWKEVRKALASPERLCRMLEEGLQQMSE